MSFCGKCGSKIEEGEGCLNCKQSKRNFCGDCGKEIINGSICDCKVIKKTSIKESAINFKEKIGMKGIIGASIIVIAGVSYIGLNNYFSNPNKILEKFTTAINENNPELLSKVVTGDEELQINAENLKGLTDYLHKDKEEFKEISGVINAKIKQIEILEKSGKISIDRLVSADNKENLGDVLNLVQGKKKFGLFETYTLKIKPTYITVKSKFQDTKVIVNGQDQGIIDVKSKITDGYEKKLGPFVPGELVVEAVSATNEKIKDKQEINLISGGNTEVGLLQNAYEVKVTSNKVGAEVFINDKSYGKITEEEVVSGKEIGPLFGKSEIYGKIKEGDKEQNTQVKTTSEEGSINLEFVDLEEVKKEFERSLKTTLENYAEGFASAVNYNNFSYIDSYLEPGSSIYTQQRTVIESIYEQGIREDFLKLEIVNYEYDEEKMVGTVETSEIYDIINTNGDIKTKTIPNKYKFKYDEESNAIKLTDYITQ